MTTAPADSAGGGARAGDVRQTINESSMSRFQMTAVAVCTALNMLDGFDVLVVAFTASALAADWELSGKQLGVLLSAGLFGMAAGSLFLAPWGDRFGRRAIILVCLALITVGMLLSGLAQNPVQLATLRVLTGIGIGGMLASIGVITSEYSSNKWRSTSISLQATGYPVGATVGGAIAAVLIANYGWRSAFFFGGIASILMVPVVLRSLPESMDFLIARRPPRALERLNELFRRMGHAPVSRLPDPPATDASAPRNPVSGLFAGSTANSTMLIWSSFFLLMFSFYFIMSWTPRLLVTAGLSAQQGITGGVLLNLGGIVGGSLFACFAPRFGTRRLACWFLAITAVATVLFAFFATDLAMAFLIALLIGTFLIGSMAGLYSLAPVLYPAAVRTTGMGWAIGIGRIGAILSPMIAGLLVDAGWTTTMLYCAFVLPLIAAVLTTRMLKAA